MTERLLRPLVGYADHVVRDRQTLEYWLTQEPYLGTRRTLAHVESFVGSFFDERPVACIAGWLFDLYEGAQRLRISCGGGEVGVVIHPIDRHQQALRFPGERNAFQSGFSTFVYLDSCSPEIMSLEFSYDVRGGEVVHGILPLPALTWAINSATACADRAEETSFETDVVIVTPLHSCPERAVVHAVMREVALLEASVTCIGGHDAESVLLDAMGPYRHKGTPVVMSDYAALAESLVRFKHRYKVIIFVHPLDAALQQTVLPPLLASSGVPAMVLANSEENFSMPAFIGGDLLDVVRWSSPASFSPRLRMTLLRLLGSR